MVQIEAVTSNKKTGAERINGGQQVRVSEEPVAFVHRGESRYGPLLEEIIGSVAGDNVAVAAAAM